jgi:hypothetical protein
VGGLVKIDSSGNVQWIKSVYGGYRVSMVGTSDGGFALCSDLTLVKTDSEGNAQWTKGVGPDGQAHSLIQTRDGGYAITGVASLPTADGQNWITYSWIVKTDSEGNYPTPLSPSPSPLPTASPTLTASPSPTVPEFTPVAVLILTVVTCIVAAAIRKRLNFKPSHEEPLRSRATLISQLSPFEN